MDFIDELKQFSLKAAKLVPMITTEEATKNALILPFFRLLGYDVFNPMEFVPEYVADVGIKTGEKVDYAILRDGNPVILIEAKWCGENLDKYSSQLYRYFGTSTAKIAILTNGVFYRFYTDLDAENKMDFSPFMEFNILDMKDGLLPELKRFQRENLDLDTIFDAASDLKYTYAIKQLLIKQMNDPDGTFIAYVLGEIYQGYKRANVLEKFKPIIKRSFTQFINDLLNDRFKSMLSSSGEEVKAEKAADESPEEESKINTTVEEIEAYFIVKALLHDTVDPSRLLYKDTESYFGILLDGKVTKWICRFQLEGSKKCVHLPLLEDGKQVRIMLKNNNSIYQYKDLLIKAAEMRLNS